MSTRFIACENCARHVRAGDAACPFCGARAPVARPVRTIAQRLSRAAMHAAGAAGAAGAFVALNDCGSGGGGGSGEAFYGAPCIDGSCNTTVDAGQDTGQDAYIGAGEPFYGGACVDGSCVVVEAGPDAAGDQSAPPADAAPEADDAPVGDAAKADSGD
ncbi:MAG TPA: hypothetical protein VGL81_07995 [Polyangiaceae bacterium]